MQRRKLSIAALIGASVMTSGCHVDMWRQPKSKAYSDSDFFSDRQASRPLVEGTVARGQLYPDNGYYTGKENGKEITAIPADAVTAIGGPKEMLERGKNRYDVYCAPCHGQIGNGNGFIAQRGMGFWQKLPASLLQKRVIESADGHIFDVIVHGKGAMYGYASRIQDVNDRWAIVSYVRVLQRASGAEIATALPVGEPIKLTATPAPNTTPAPVTPTAIAEEQASLDSAMAKITGDVLFDTGKYEIKPEAKQFLDAITPILAKYPKSNVEIGGHTDSQGDAAKNLALSDSRATAVRNYLISKGVSAVTLSEKGYGQTKPVTDNNTPESRAKNRRITFSVLGGAK
jgi:outer membrane protein OmpA-like peptidoglycan-associated protein